MFLNFKKRYAFLKSISLWVVELFDYIEIPIGTITEGSGNYMILSFAAVAVLQYI